MAVDHDTRQPWHRWPKYRTRLAVLQFIAENPGRMVQAHEVSTWMEHRGMPFGRRPSTAAIRRALTRLASKQAPGVWLCVRRERPRRAKQIPLEM